MKRKKHISFRIQKKCRVEEDSQSHDVISVTSHNKRFKSKERTEQQNSMEERQKKKKEKNRL